ncbi:MAG: rhomboid family intramembrane serine protease [Anaerolineaceae bacterium]|nr:rhomboid family intramembrane serine protease [Anaerolineaceae bacterium]
MNYPPGNTPPQTPLEENANQRPDGPQQRMVAVKPPNLSRPIVTYVILGLTIFTYLLQELSKAGIGHNLFLTFGNLIMGSELMNLLITQSGSQDLLLLIGSKISPLIVDGQIWRLITPVLLHASIAHIGFNMYALFVIGPQLESFYGRWRYLALYLLGALGGNILSFWLTTGLSVGASTAIFALVAAQGVFIFQNRAMFGARARGMLNNTLFIVAINLMLGLTGGIDNWGHLGGLLTGLAFAWFAGPRLSVDFSLGEPQLSDQRSSTTTWLVAIVVGFILAALTLLRIRQG